MRKKKLATVIVAALMTVTTCACSLTGSSSKEKEPIRDDMPEGIITDETSSLGINANATDLESKLENNMYYVVHDGYYYPVFSSYTSPRVDDASPADIAVPSADRQRYYTLEDEAKIPTLFPGDQLIFYSKDLLLESVTFERYYDMGETFGIRGLQRTEGGRYYLPLKDDEDTALYESELYELYGLGVSNILIDKIGGVQVTDAMVENGLIIGASRNQTYDMEIYTGTVYKHVNAVANFRAFRSYELYCTLQYTTLKDNFFEIQIPSCLTTGYYDVDGLGLMRLCKDSSFSSETDFNVQTLYPAISGSFNLDEDEEPIVYREDEVYSVADYEEFMELYETYRADDQGPLYCPVYSEDEEINRFKTNIYGTPGFVDPNEDPYTDEAKVKEKAETMKIAKQIKYDLWFPKDKDCQIIIPTDEGTGEAFIKFSNGSINALEYNKLDKQYETSFTGQGIRGTIVIGGLTKGYDINLKNAVLYDNQDGLEGKDIE